MELMDGCYLLPREEGGRNVEVDATGAPFESSQQLKRADEPFQWHLHML